MTCAITSYSRTIRITELARRRGVYGPDQVDGFRLEDIPDTSSFPDPFAVADVESLLRFLDPRSRLVVERRYGIRGSQATLDQIAVDLGITRERVRQIECKALDRIRAMMVPRDRR